MPADASVKEWIVAPQAPEALLDSLLRWLAPMSGGCGSRTPVDRLPGLGREQLKSLLTELEAALRGNRLSVRHTAEQIQSLLAQTSAADSFDPVITAVRRLQSREALAALSVFKRGWPTLAGASQATDRPSN
jgi:hypothetical protein